jgi:small subunit ribosomal protein S16
MVRIRLTRTGLKKQPSYRVVVADKDAKRDGKILELIGHYNPRTEPLTFKIEEDRALYWLSVGAQPSDAVRRLLEKQGTMNRLARLHGGETLAALVAEYEGKPLASQPAPVAAEPVAEPAVEMVEPVLEPVMDEESAAAEPAE